MPKLLEEFRIEFLNSAELIADISQFCDVPPEISNEDVYDYSLLFKNEEVALEYCCKNYGVSRDQIEFELHEEDSLRKEFGKANYLRTAHIEFTTYISELNDGTYILWSAF